MRGTQRSHEGHEGTKTILKVLRELRAFVAQFFVARFLLFRDTELRQLRRDILPGARRLHRLVDVEDLAVGADVERPARGDAQPAQDAVGSRDLL